LSAEQRETALVRVPSLLEIFGHSYFFGGFLVGPQVGLSVGIAFERFWVLFTGPRPDTALFTEAN